MTFLQEKCFQYWPSEGSVTFGDYTVELTADTQCETFTLKDMVLTSRPVRAHLNQIKPEEGNFFPMSKYLLLQI